MKRFLVHTVGWKKEGMISVVRLAEESTSSE